MQYLDSSTSTSKKTNSSPDSSLPTMDMAESPVTDMVSLSSHFYHPKYTTYTNIPGSLTTIQNGKPVKEITPTVEPPTWTEYYRKLARALAGQGDLPASGEEASKVIRLIELAKESSKLGKTLDV